MQLGISALGHKTVEPNRRLFPFSFPRNQISARAVLISGVFTWFVGLNLAKHLAGKGPGYSDRASLETNSGKTGEWLLLGAKGQRTGPLVKDRASCRPSPSTNPAPPCWSLPSPRKRAESGRSTAFAIQQVAEIPEKNYPLPGMTRRGCRVNWRSATGATCSGLYRRA
jgi:hypothetical protein